MSEKEINFEKELARLKDEVATPVAKGGYESVKITILILFALQVIEFDFVVILFF